MISLTAKKLEVVGRPKHRIIIHAFAGWKCMIVLILFGILARLYGISAPPYSVHDLRQYETAAIARNFFDGSLNILYPQVDWRGSSPGYVESEFQIYTFLVALLYRTFGVHEWLGSGLNIVFYIVSAILLFRLVQNLFDERVALFSVFFYSFVPLSVVFTRSFQPDALMALSSLAGVYYFSRWMEEERWTSLLISALGISLAILIKPMNLYLGLPLLYLAQGKFGWRLLRQPVLWVFAVAVVLPSLFWYFHAFYLWQTYGNTLIRGYTELSIPPLNDPFWQGFGIMLLGRIVYLVATPPGLLFLTAGFFVRPKRNKYLLYWWALGFVISMLLANEPHNDHEYYQLPIVFITASWMGIGAAMFLDRNILWSLAVGVWCVLVAGWGLLQAWQILQVPPWQIDRVNFGKRVNELTEPGSRVIFAYWQDDPRRGEWYQHRTPQGEYLFYMPAEFYLSHRKGWSINKEQVSPEFVETLRNRGAKYFATLAMESFKKSTGLKAWLDCEHVALDVTSKWAIYRLRKPAAGQTSTAICGQNRKSTLR
jgi:hypothetical protein